MPDYEKAERKTEELVRKFIHNQVSREDYSGWAARTLVDKLFRGSARDLVTALVKSDGLSERDLAELRELFQVEGD